MISESRYWKEPLLEAADWLESVRLRERTKEETLVRIEREVFVSFYAIRKLFETLKVSDKTKEMTINIEWHPNVDPVNHLNSIHLDRLYDFGKTSTETRKALFLCHQFVHSFIFSPFEEYGVLGGFFVTSDQTKDEKLYR
ncbi:MAG: hypothetical protein AAF991_00085, partial [Pseudomonadota bacterium]